LIFFDCYLNTPIDPLAIGAGSPTNRQFVDPVQYDDKLNSLHPVQHDDKLKFVGLTKQDTAKMAFIWVGW